MRIFHFDIAGVPLADDEGIELCSVAEARAVSLLYVGQLLKEQSDEFWHGGDLILNISDDRRLILFSLVVSAHDATSLGKVSEETERSAIVP